MERRRSIAFAALASAVLVASSAAFAVANGIFRSPSADRVGTFRALEQLLPAEPAASPPASGPPPAGPDETTTGAPGAVGSGNPPPDGDRTPDTTPARSEDPPRVVTPTSTTTTTTSTASTIPKKEKDDDGDDADHPEHDGAGDDD